MAHDDSLTESLLKASSHDALPTPQPQQPLPPQLRSPYHTSGCFSRLAFLWLDSLLRLGYSRPLQLHDIPSLSPPDQVDSLYSSFAQAWHAQQQQHPSKPPSLTLALVTRFWKLALLTGILALIRTLALVAGPLFLRYIIEYMSGEEFFPGAGYVLVAGLFAGKMIESLSQRHWFFGCRRLGMQMQAALTAAVFQKELRLSSTGRRCHGAGQIVRYISVDVYRLGDFAWYMHYLWVLPVQIASAMIILLPIVGVAILPGLAIILLIMMLNTPLARSLQKCHAQFIAAQDQRLRAITEILNSIKVIKLQAWEDRFRTYVQGLRDVEFAWLSKAQRRRGTSSILYWMTPIIVGSAVFASCIWFKKPLNAVTIFTVMATFRIIQEPLKLTPEVLASAIQVMVSLDHLGSFLRDDELPDDAVERICHPSDFVIRVDDASVSWDPMSPTPTLKAINLMITQAQKVGVCGAVGSGKSSLLYTILGEISKLSGHVQVCGSIAYVPQSAWIQSATVRDNILFGKRMDEARFRSTLKASALEKDIESFAFGDLTVIGERGLNLSGGQKQRIQLARAMYSDADIYLLDDPFSAVDAETATALFHGYVMGALCEKTVVLVTHQLEFLRGMDNILVMQGGEIEQSGTYEKLLYTGETFETLLNAHKAALNTISFGQNTHPEDGSKDQSIDSQKNLMMKTAPSPTEKLGNLAQLVQEEEKEKGAMGLKPYTAYITVSKGIWVFFLMSLGLAAFFASQSLSNIWLATGIYNSNISIGLLIGVYAALSALGGVFIHMKSELNVALGLKASKEFFNAMTQNLFRAPMSFFDSNPTGRILSRASTDLSVMDLDIPFCFGFVVGGAMELSATLVIFAIVNWEILLVAIPMVFVIQWIQKYYVTSSRELMRLNSTTKAPIVNFSAEALQGAATIRAFGMVERFKRKNSDLINSDASLYFYNHAAVEWLIQRVEILSNIVLCAAGLLLITLSSNRLTPGRAALALTYSMSLSIQLVFWIQWQCKFVNYAVSVERINQYLKLPSEAPAILENNRPPQQWPSKGRVAFINLKVRYQPNAPLVLYGITCKFEGGQRVGIVGRTGSGKTTLISSLFRLVEPAGGKILIDDIDICSIGLYDLRSRLGIIPQDPAMFRGTVRTNLDPLGQYSDDDIWETLDRCQLGKDIRQSPCQLDSPVADEGENWSAGQRQLFCLGRVLLKHSQILVLDEATASVDSQTDAFLQKVLRNEFKNSTVMTVAHRIPTIIDSDKVMDLQNGHLMEFDTPKRLLEDENSLFTKLVISSNLK